MSEPMQHIVLMGAPGSGKGTQAEILVRELGLHTFSTGQLLREEAQSGSELGVQISTLIDNGQFVPDDILMRLVQKEMSKPQYQDGYVLDGVPRTEAQAKALDTMLSSGVFKEKNMGIDCVILIDVPDHLLVDRIAGRYACAGCGAIYHDQMKRPHTDGVCDVCGSTKFTRRADDNRETVEKRISTYHRVTAPILPYYEQKGLLKVVDGTGSADSVSKKIKEIILTK